MSIVTELRKGNNTLTMKVNKLQEELNMEQRKNKELRMENYGLQSEINRLRKVIEAEKIKNNNPLNNIVKVLDCLNNI